MARAPSPAREARALPSVVADRYDCHGFWSNSPSDDVAHRSKRKLNFSNFGFRISAVDFAIRASVEKTKIS
jgi:hypothetical protein